VEVAAVHLGEALLALRHLRESLEVTDPGRLEAIEERLEVLGRLKRKYGDTEDGMLAFLDAAARELERLEHHEEFLAAEEQRVAELRGELGTAAERLSATRGATAARLAWLVQRELRALGMDKARFEVAVDQLATEHISARGLDRVELRLSANPGEELRPLARIASGGELSRIMLAVQSVLAVRDGIPTMIFDEVDDGIGGRIAAVVADKLAGAARGRQILCVTHLASIAARADHHLAVSKSVRAGRTRAGTRVLTGVARVDEIARMLGGEAVTDTARRHARELLASAGEARTAAGRLYNGPRSC
jgi:DNA repair protein RecN (Recombination protein N)